MQCCGAGGGVRGYDIVHSLDITNEKLINLKDVGVDALTDICPFCQLQFDRGQIEIKEKFGVSYDLPVLHYLRTARPCTGNEPAGAWSGSPRNQLRAVPAEGALEVVMMVEKKKTTTKKTETKKQEAKKVSSRKTGSQEAGGGSRTGCPECSRSYPVATTQKEARIGVFICHCGTNIAGSMDIQAVQDYAKTVPHVAYVDNYKYMCSMPGQTIIQKAVKENNLTGVVVAACTPPSPRTDLQDCNKKDAGSTRSGSRWPTSVTRIRGCTCTTARVRPIRQRMQSGSWSQRLHSSRISSRSPCRLNRRPWSSVPCRRHAGSP